MLPELPVELDAPVGAEDEPDAAWVAEVVDPDAEDVGAVGVELTVPAEGVPVVVPSPVLEPVPPATPPLGAPAFEPAPLEPVTAVGPPSAEVGSPTPAPATPPVGTAPGAVFAPLAGCVDAVAAAGGAFVLVSEAPKAGCAEPVADAVAPAGSYAGAAADAAVESSGAIGAAELEASTRRRWRWP